MASHPPRRVRARSSLKAAPAARSPHMASSRSPYGTSPYGEVEAGGSGAEAGVEGDGGLNGVEGSGEVGSSGSEAVGAESEGQVVIVP